VIIQNAPVESGLSIGKTIPEGRLKYVLSLLVLSPLKREPMFKRYPGSKTGILFLYALGITTGEDKR
jgi:hypothetical protein